MFLSQFKDFPERPLTCNLCNNTKMNDKYQVMFECNHNLFCDMIVKVFDVNESNTRNTDSLNVYIPKPNIECY